MYQQQMLPKLHKPPKLKPLALSDIVVALINQQHTVDQTEQYKKMLGQRWAITSQQQQHESEQLVLPQFATQEYTPQEILDYHIRNKITQTIDYQMTLRKVYRRINVAMLQYGDKLKEGQKGIETLMESLAIACTKIQQSRTNIKLSTQKLNKCYSKVAPTLRKISNISKVIEILSVWGKSKIPYLFSIDISQPYHYDIEDVLHLFHSAQTNLKNNPQIETSQSLKSILVSLEQKQQKLISSICTIFTQSIINFTNSEQYNKKYKQYSKIVELGYCKDVLNIENMKTIIQMNGKQILHTVLGKLSTNMSMNIDMLNQVVYLEFYEEVMEEFVMYFSSWHYVTTYHIDSGSQHAQLFLQNRRQVFLSFSQIIAHSIENSKKFMSLEYKIKLQLVEKLQDFMEAGEKWMGTYQNILLPKIVTSKLSKQLQSIFNLYNNLIKNILSQQISVIALEHVQDPKPPHAAKTSTHINDINYSKVSTFLSSSSGNKAHVDGVEKTYQNIPEPPLIRLKMGQIFAEMISEYLQRSKYLQSNKSVYLIKIHQHFQFILFMLYQLCIREQIKNKMSINIAAQLLTNQTHKNQQVSSISLKKLNQLTNINIFKHKYTHVVEFLTSCGSKYDGIKIAGIIDCNKLYDSTGSDVVLGYNLIIGRVVDDLRSILKWLVASIPHTQLRGYRECSKIAKLQHILLGIYGLTLQNYTAPIYKKYMQAIPPIMLKLKWQIKKFNQQTSNSFKQYKTKLIEIFRKHTLLNKIKPECPELCETIMNKQVECMYHAMLESYGKIEKINDNGRQIMRLDCVEITKMLNQLGVRCQVWVDWFDKYLDMTSERNYKIVLEKLATVGLFYEPACWKYQLMWVVGDMSSKQKKQYNSGLAKIYMDFLRT